MSSLKQALNSNIGAEMMDNPLLSICIATYNRAQYLAQCLESFIYQAESLEEGLIEVLISDNCSTDNTSEIVEKYLGRFRFIRYFVNNENIGPEKNVLGLPYKARGKYVWFMGDDDLVLEAAVEKLLAYLKNGAYGFIMLNKTVRNSDLSEIILEKQSLIDKDIVYPGVKELCKEFGYVTNLGYLTTSVFDRAIFCSIDRTPYMNTYFPQCGIFLEGFYNKPSIYICTPLVCHRQYNQGDLWGIWQYVLSICICRTFKTLAEKGVLESSFIGQITEYFIGYIPRSYVGFCLENLSILVNCGYYISDEDWETVIGVFNHLEDSGHKEALANIFNSFLDKYFSSDDVEIIPRHIYYKATDFVFKLGPNTYSLALDLFQSVFKMRSGDEITLLNIGICAFEIGSTDIARNIFNLLLPALPDHPRLKRYCMLSGLSIKE